MIIEITTEFIKLDQFLKYTGEAENGAMAKDMILEGLVKVNGEIELRRGRKLYICASSLYIFIKIGKARLGIIFT